MRNFLSEQKYKLAALAGVVGAFAATSLTFAAGTLEASDTLPIVKTGIDSLKENLVSFLPVILPVAITLAIFFGAYYWIKHAGHGR